MFDKDSNDSNDSIATLALSQFITKKIFLTRSLITEGWQTADLISCCRGEIFIILSCHDWGLAMAGRGWPRMSVLNLTIYRLVWRRNMPLCLTVFTYLGNESSGTVHCSVRSNVCIFYIFTFIQTASWLLSVYCCAVLHVSYHVSASVLF